MTQTHLPNHDPDSVREAVRKGYAAIADSPKEAAQSCCGPSCCGGGTATSHEELYRGIGYGESDLGHAPEGANMGLGCGNPTALAGLHEGEVVLDLGAGGGMDAFIAGRRVGPAGWVIGVDMTPEMVQRARRNLTGYRERSGLDNVEFRLGEIEHLPVADASVDVVISNCVLNLSPAKEQVWREIARVLRPGGRVAVSDLALVRPLPAAVAAHAQALVGCIAGAVLIEETRAMMESAGLEAIELERKDAYIDAMTSWNDPLYAAIVAELPAGTRASDFVTSLNISARKPGAA